MQTRFKILTGILTLVFLGITFSGGYMFGLKKAAEKNKVFKKTIMVDLDGVLNDYKKYDKNYIPFSKHGVEDFLIELTEKDNYRLVLFTARNRRQAKKWLKSAKIDKYFDDVTDKKLPAYIYLDDRAIQFDGDYAKALEQIKTFKPYWQE